MTELQGDCEMREEVISKIRYGKIITIVRGVYGQHITQLAQALLSGGINIMEVTFDQNEPSLHKETMNAISSIRDLLGDEMTVGAGTVTSLEMLEKACQAGSQFIVSPNTDEIVIRRTVDLGMVSIPGALTPTEIHKAYDGGADFVKVFPTSQFGADYIRAIRAPLNNVPLLAVGGISKKNIREFLEAGCVGVGVGGNLVNKQWIENGDFAMIASLAREYCLEIAQANN